ncbi:MAG: LptF/LptG family permease [Acetobacter sp.]|jgi:lipopolysaccharide export system permease protein|nr:LptF/LptG family permease [Acetobacter sp.]MCH4061587.1 LptF/LptG family permease [Acetobacter sp.]MCH4089564.1 LptF/LptG family permease [Acetobacter sp.]MCI1294718.1 LptF/LptG family permease [Acetobacter sp.]MCI1321417.1 LptF/LptG family permease [Acetobacter sp.]
MTPPSGNSGPTAAEDSLVDRLIARLPQRVRPGTIDRYLLSQLAPPFLLTVAVVLLALLLERMLALIDRLAEEDSALSTFFRLLTNLLPHYLGLALPAAFCVAVFVVTRRMSDGHEIDALGASGVSMTRFSRPFIQAGIALGLFSFFLYGYAQPHARYQFRAGFYYASHAGWEPVLQSGVIVTPSANLALIADHASHSGSHLRGIFIRDTSGKEEQDISAREGRIRSDLSAGEVQIELHDGFILTRPESGPPSITRFSTAKKLLARNSAPPFRARGKDDRELTTTELVNALLHHTTFSETDLTQHTMWAELCFRLARSTSIPFIAFLATGLGIIAKRKRGNTGLAIAALILVSYEHTLKFGASLVSLGKTSSLLAIWLPVTIFCIGSTLVLLIRGDILRNFFSCRKTVDAGGKS